ncbi:Crp/Fnr family transcriptional regulator [Opitutaceae bacterium TAV5]|nr:Crp/Fnr family transcriptional regulator [Opitutaceae bacterium TAV5]
MIPAGSSSTTPPRPAASPLSGGSVAVASPLSSSAAASGPAAASAASALASPGKSVALLGPLLLLTFPIYWVFARSPETPVGPGTWALVFISALANVIVIAYHYIIPAHPKFLMVPWRRRILRIHILSGSIELVAGFTACVTGNVPAALVTACAALFFHVPSAFFQTPGVFGSKAIMVPSYLLCIVTHGFCAGMLLAHPESRMWAVNTFLVFNIYVWCRIYYYIFDMLRLFSPMKYSIAILAAGATMIPALFGSLGFLLLVTFIGAYILLYRLVFIRTPAEYNDFVREKARDSTLPPDSAHLWRAATLADSAGEDAARNWFDGLDRDHDGQLDGEELQQALAPWGLSAAAAAACADRLLASGPVDFERFRRDLWSIGAIRSHALHAIAVERAVTDRDKAGLVFRHLDIDGDGLLGATELDLLLLEWGLPESETDRYLARTDRDADGRITFAEFLHKMEPVWRYIYHDVFRATWTRRPREMIGRGLSAVLDARKTDALRERVKRDLLRRVPFLAGAGDELIGDLAASLVSETFPAGATLVTEGSEGDKFYLVAAGLVRVSKAGEILADLGPGGCIGEGSLLTDEPRSATITAVHPSTLFALTRAAFSWLTENHPHIRAQLRALHENRRIDINTRALRRQLAGRVPFLRDLNNTALVADLADEMQPVFFKGGETILREGEPGNRFYMVATGAVRISRKGETFATLHAGGCFGEGALLSASARRAATAVADGNTRLFSLDREAFETILARHPAVRETLLALNRSRVSSTP